MKTKDFLSKLNHEQLVAEIAKAEAGTSGEIRVFVQRGPVGHALTDARTQFRKLGMEKTKERNGILIFVAPRARQFAVIGDEGVHAKCGPQFWKDLVEAMGAHFRKEDFTAAITHAIHEAGDLLGRYFPRQDGDRDELANDIAEG